MRDSDSGKLILSLGEEFVGRPYGGRSAKYPETEVYIQLDSMNCVTFVETVTALALTVREGRSSWRDFVYNLKALRYRGGQPNGFASRLHYVTDWGIDVAHRGLIKEVTSLIGSPSYAVKTLDFMSRNKNQYPELADEKNLEQIKNVEMGYKSHRYPYLKRGAIKGAELKDGDIVALTSTLDGLDVGHIGLIIAKKDGVHLLHASSKEGVIMIDECPLAEYLLKNRQFGGIRVFRITQ